MKNRAALLKTLSMPLALAAIWIFFALKLDSDALRGLPDSRFVFLGPRNLSQLMVEFSITGTLALGMFMILLTGQIDLSVGSGVGLIGGLAAVLVTKHDWVKDALYKTMKDFGPCPSPFDCWLLNLGMKTLPIRMEKHCQNAKQASRERLKIFHNHTPLSSMAVPSRSLREIRRRTVKKCPNQRADENSTQAPLPHAFAK